MNLPTAIVLVLSGVGLGLTLRSKKTRAARGFGAERIVSAARDEEGWVLLDSDGDVQPWPDEWPSEVDSVFFAGRGWKQVNVGSEARPQEGWMAPPDLREERGE